VIDGTGAAAFLGGLKGTLEQPDRLRQLLDRP
jgi:hypothetical protein